jgi:hypothetical protein
MGTLSPESASSSPSPASAFGQSEEKPAMMIRIAIWMLLVTAAARVLAAPSADATYSGEYFYNFENSFLTPDGKKENWCVDSPLMTKAMLPAKDSTEPWGMSHVVVRGRIGALGKYGGLGRCNRLLTVTALVEVSNMRGPNDLGKAP